MPHFRLLYELVHFPTSTGTLEQRYSVMLDQCEVAERGGFEAVRIHEHHGSVENYASSPLTIATAIAARTRTMRVRSLILTPFYDPVKLAEDVATMDILSGGRTELLLAAGYRKDEFRMFRTDLADRRTIVDSTAEFLRQAWTGEQFDFQGRKGRVRPIPVQQPH